MVYRSILWNVLYSNFIQSLIIRDSYGVWMNSLKYVHAFLLVTSLWIIIKNSYVCSVTECRKCQYNYRGGSLIKQGCKNKFFVFEIFSANDWYFSIKLFQLHNLVMDIKTLTTTCTNILGTTLIVLNEVFFVNHDIFRVARFSRSLNRKRCFLFHDWIVR